MNPEEKFTALLRLLVIFFFTIDGQAALVTHIERLDIGGVFYEVSINAGESFNTLWDADGDGTFGNDTSIISAKPTFWENGALAATAAQALVDYFAADGSSGTTASAVCAPGGFCDGFIIPVSRNVQDGTLSVLLDNYALPEIDSIITLNGFSSNVATQFNHLVSFRLAPPSIPETTKVPLIGLVPLTLLGLGLAGVGYYRVQKNPSGRIP